MISSGPISSTPISSTTMISGGLELFTFNMSISKLVTLILQVTNE